VPWRGPEFAGDFPTLGVLLGQWIEENCIIPTGPRRGYPYLLTGEMWQHMVHVYRLRPSARVHAMYPRPRDGFVYHGNQLRRPQKWGKDPLMAVKAIAHALGPVQFDGWDANGEPVGRPVPTPWVQIAGTSIDNTLNTWRPLVAVLREGPLADTPGLDVGDTRVKLPFGDGWIEPVTASADSRLGNPITYATITEPHLMTARDGGLEMAKAIKRNLTGMGGSWSEGTNAWDPSQDSVAQQTAQAKAPEVYLDHREPDLAPLTEEEFADDDRVRERIVVKYGDSARAAGGWVETEDILADVRNTATGEAEARRYFLDEVVVGQRDAVNAPRWDALAFPVADNGGLLPGDRIVLGFDGSRVLDATALIGCRVRDGRWFTLGIWDPMDYSPGRDERGRPLPGQVPEAEVEQAIEDAFAAYEVWHLYADPYRWQTVLNRVAGRHPTNPAEKAKPTVVDLPTNEERRFDAAIVMWQTAMRSGVEEFSHDGDGRLRKHAMNAALATGGRKPEREVEDGTTSRHYLKIVKKRKGWKIDGLIAGILATYARSRAIEEGALNVTESVDPWVFTS
jgi:hypothetical protein